MENYIDYKGYRYYYEHRLAEHGVSVCLATKDPTAYCNGFFLYSDKDPGDGEEFVITRHNNPGDIWESC